MSETHGGVVPGWYPDPAGRYELRYHNGGVWTADVSTNGERYVDPFGTSPTPPVHPVPGTGSPGGRNGMAIAAMVLGIVSIGVGWLPFVVVAAIVAAILAVVFGFIGRSRATRTGVGGGFALTGIITGFVGMAVSVVGVLFTVVFVQELDRYSNPEPNATEITGCRLDGSTATAEGTITNLGDETADFAIRVEFVRPGTDNPDRRTRVSIEDLAPGATTSFEVSRTVSLDEIDCLIGRVDGPLPFGVEVEN